MGKVRIDRWFRGSQYRGKKEAPRISWHRPVSRNQKRGTSGHPVTGLGIELLPVEKRRLDHMLVPHRN